MPGDATVERYGLRLAELIVVNTSTIKSTSLFRAIHDGAIASTDDTDPLSARRCGPPTTATLRHNPLQCRRACAGTRIAADRNSDVNRYSKSMADCGARRRAADGEPREPPGTTFLPTWRHSAGASSSRALTGTRQHHMMQKLAAAGM
ncbi:MAG: hypothetical protein H6872_11150 [Methylobacteriaceae bacterium]|nr:hypothetical protein [Methylobacteriaceae bacterium]